MNGSERMKIRVDGKVEENEQKTVFILEPDAGQNSSVAKGRGLYSHLEALPSNV